MSPPPVQSELQLLLDELSALYRKIPASQRAEPIKSIVDRLKAQGKAYIIDFTLCYLNPHGGSKEVIHQRQSACEDILPALFKSAVIESEADFRRVFTALRDSARVSRIAWNLPTLPILKQLERFAAKNPLSSDFKAFLKETLEGGELTPDYPFFAKEANRIKARLAILIDPDSKSVYFPRIRLDERDPIGLAINQTLDAAPVAERNLSYGLLALFQKVSGGQPSTKFRQQVNALYKQYITPGYYVRLAKAWLSTFGQLTTHSDARTYPYTGGGQYTYVSHFFIHETNATVIKGLIWSLIGLTEEDEELLTLLTRVAEKGYQKIPGQGPAAAGVGNACLYIFAQSGLPGIAHLSRLKLRIKQASAQDLIHKYIQQASAQLQVSAEAIEDMAVSDYNLVDGQWQQAFGDYQVTGVIQSSGKVELRWTKADGTPLKSEPAAVKKEYAAALKTLKATAADLARNLTAQRDRLDRNLVLDRQWSWPSFSAYYADHGLMQLLTRQLIWIFEQPGQRQEVFWQQEGWATLEGEKITGLDPDTTVRLWHPVGKTVDNVLAWRQFMEQRQIRQPMKQAFREVYLITDAELNTRVYSNRMAAHLLKQHQFSTLAKGRGWRYRLLGAYDKGYEAEKARIDLPSYDLQAEFWVSEVAAENAFNDTGIWLYVSTDQVRFTRLDNSEPLNLIDIPPLVFSEIMRDVDLFVGVASVGNDPNWQNGGLTQFRTYWESYSFGELGELARTRRQALEKIVPRLKIGQVAEIKDKFLVVQGKLRTYKIHLGSGNSLMEPNDQYLCIVPDRSANKVSPSVFLPFEGDALLSVILSKALLLAEDDKITDPTITRQIAFQ